jgi:hypothetical protein
VPLEPGSRHDLVADLGHRSLGHVGQRIDSLKHGHRGARLLRFETEHLAQAGHICRGEHVADGGNVQRHAQRGNHQHLRLVLARKEKGDPGSLAEVVSPVVAQVQTDRVQHVGRLPQFQLLQDLDAALGGHDRELVAQR